MYKPYTNLYDNPTQIEYSCGHISVIGGNVADPSCLIPEQEGWLTYKCVDYICDECSGKREPFKGHFIGNLETGMTWINE